MVRRRGMIWTALATWAALILYAAMGANVARARVKHAITAPAVHGDPAFERTFRVQQNTLEQIVLFLPALWMFGWFVSDVGAGVVGLVWIIGRVVYARGYYADAAKRGPGFGIASVATVTALIGSVAGIVVALVGRI
jgi:glutathione S-transferase